MFVMERSTCNIGYAVTDATFRQLQAAASMSCYWALEWRYIWRQWLASCAQHLAVKAGGSLGGDDVETVQGLAISAVGCPDALEYTKNRQSSNV